MINLTIGPFYLDDLHDDVMMNTDLNLFEFIDNDPIKAFYMGYKLQEWFEELSVEQKYLYSKQARHIKDGMDKYKEQVNFWSNKYHDNEEDVSIVDYTEYMLNNMFWEDDEDKIRFAFFFGKTGYDSQFGEKIAQYDLKGNLIKVWNSIDDIVSELRYNKYAILKCCKGEQGSHSGFKWRYYE